MKATAFPYILKFKSPGGTSRGILTQKKTWLIKIIDQEKVGWGECGMFIGLSCDDVPDFEEKLQWAMSHIHKGLDFLRHHLISYPSIIMGLETAFLSLHSKNPFELHPSLFTQEQKGITINGLIWMGSIPDMKIQIKNKLASGYNCLKLKIGALDFQSEFNLLQEIRNLFPKDILTLRVDANGAFKPEEALEKLIQLATLDLHSIEQPIKPNLWKQMACLTSNSPLPIALDEELIGIHAPLEKKQLLEFIKPAFLVLKPTLHGGFLGSKEWMEWADELDINYWITSALESNIGLNAIAQFTFQQNLKLPQGLGTGGLFVNNIKSPLYVKGQQLFIKENGTWHIPENISN